MEISLYNIERSLAELFAAREEVTDPAEAAEVEKAIRQYLVAEVEKVDGFKAYLRHCEQMAADAKATSARYAERAEKLKAAAHAVMLEHGKKRLDGLTGSLLVKGNGGLAPLTVQEDVLPDEFLNHQGSVPHPLFSTILNRIGADLAEQFCACFPVTAAANSRIRAALKAGPVPGAYLGERGTHLEVK